MNGIKGIVRSASDKIEGLYDAVHALLFGERQLKGHYVLISFAIAGLAQRVE